MKNSPFRLAALLCCLGLVLGCAGAKRRAVVRSGLLTKGLPQAAFLEVWGPPERARASKNPDADDTRLEFTPYGGSYGRMTYEIWEYPARAITLTFYRGKLFAWNTDKTTEQLRTR